MFRIRIIPATIATAVLLLGVKIADVTRGTQNLSNETLIPKVEAAPPGDTAAVPSSTPVPASTPDASAKPADSAAAKPDAAATPAKPDAKGDAPAVPAATDKKAPEEAKKAEPKKADNGAVSKNVSNAPPEDTVDHRYSTVEVELLENLARRREELDHWEQNIQIKEEALGATEKRIDDKIAQIDVMKKEVSDLLAQYNQKEDAKIRSLVKIYENMKPDDAARIFNQLEMPILLQVIDKMSEKKAAPILADMDPQKAKQVTVQLAEQHRVDTAKINMAGIPPAAGAAPAPLSAPLPAATPAPGQ